MTLALSRRETLSPETPDMTPRARRHKTGQPGAVARHQGSAERAGLVCVASRAPFRYPISLQGSEVPQIDQKAVFLFFLGLSLGKYPLRNHELHNRSFPDVLGHLCLDKLE